MTDSEHARALFPSVIKRASSARFSIQSAPEVRRRKSRNRRSSLGAAATGISTRSLADQLEMVPTSSRSVSSGGTGYSGGAAGEGGPAHRMMGLSQSIDFDCIAQKWFEESHSLRNPLSGHSVAVGMSIGDEYVDYEVEDEDDEDNSGHLHIPEFRSPVQYRKSMKYGGPAAERRKSSPTSPFRRSSLSAKCQKLKMVF